MTSIVIPEGFEQASHSPYSNLIGPFYYKKASLDDGTLKGWVGVPMEDRHIGGNQRGHGGLLLTLLDEAMGMNAYLVRSNPVVTVSLQTSFIGATLPGKFLMATAEVYETTATMAFVEGKAWCGEQLVGSANGVWKYIKRRR